MTFIRTAVAVVVGLVIVIVAIGFNINRQYHNAHPADRDLTVVNGLGQQVKFYYRRADFVDGDFRWDIGTPIPAKLCDRCMIASAESGDYSVRLSPGGDPAIYLFASDSTTDESIYKRKFTEKELERLEWKVELLPQ